MPIRRSSTTSYTCNPEAPRRSWPVLHATARVWTVSRDKDPTLWINARIPVYNEQTRIQARWMSNQSDDEKGESGTASEKDGFASSTATTTAKPLRTILTAPSTHENIYTLPNILTFTRLLAAPGVGYLLLQDAYIPALSLFLYAGITDLLDGWLARRYHTQTVVGTIIDPMADKALMTIVVVGLAWKGLLPLTLTVVILGRDVLLSLSAIYYRYISLPPPRTLARYWDFSLPSAEVRPTGISKFNTFLQLVLVAVTMGGLALGDMKKESSPKDTGERAAEDHAQDDVSKENEETEGNRGMAQLSTGLGPTGMKALGVSWWIVGATTIASGLSYVGGRKGLRILSQAPTKKPRT
ncbi:MAG: hypothetical protein OHK93_003720 [Ramalina farinacea]|uniref:Cardiolipin synthase n=1 Tax=Ramalina farinacea TaxID=258253 RepID=A0AA43QWA6_9LECA|nr:hypothetical protein [Ramalina farinacea]